MENLTTNKSILDWLQTRIDLLQPDKVVWIDGSEEQIQALKDEAVATGEFIKLNEEKLPDCYFHRTNPNDVARVEDRTFICTPTKAEAGPLNNWMDPDECYKTLDDIIRGTAATRARPCMSSPMPCAKSVPRLQSTAWKSRTPSMSSAT